MLVRIATRESELAMQQATWVGQQLQSHYPDIFIEYVAMTTTGDKMLSAPLAKVGGKGLFLKELEQALLNNVADIAVHSMKDVTVELPTGLCLPVICERHDPRDAFVSAQKKFFDLPEGAVIGTSSLRRASQLQCLRPDIQIKDLRGNVQTRLRKLDQGEYDGIVLAAAGLKRLSLDERIRHYFDSNELLPAVGQGAIGIECREGDTALIEVLTKLNHQDTQSCVLAERAMNAALEGGCQVPIAGYAKLYEGELCLSGLVASIDGVTKLQAAARGPFGSFQRIGEEVAQNLLSQGAAEIISAVYELGSQSDS